MPICPSCGKEYIDGASFCGTCGTKTEQEKAEVSISYAEDHKAGGGDSDSMKNKKDFPVANIGKRIISGLIDIFVAMALLVPFYRFASLRAVSKWAIIPFLLPCIYLLGKEAIKGQSLGKFITGLVCYNLNENKPAGLIDSIIRNWFLSVIIVPPYLFFINLGMFIFWLLALVLFIQIVSRQKQRMGDGWANTQVIDSSLLNSQKK